jgi:xanthine dehydrogenase YagR molybdenum-binding subunit
VRRIEGIEKVTGRARYAFEYPVENVVYVHPVQSTVARGRIRSIDPGAALATPGVLAVLSPDDPPSLGTSENPELNLFQSYDVAHRGQIVAAVVAETLETAREAARSVRIEYDADPHDVRLRTDHPGLYRPARIVPNSPPDTERGDVEGGLATADVVIDATYTTPPVHNNAMEPHAAIAVWEQDGGLTLYDTTQGPHRVRDTIANVLELEPERVRVISPHVGGGFGSKGSPRPHVMLAALAARAAGRPAKVALTRQQMYDVTGYRTPTIQRLRLGADAGGRLTAIAHDVVEQTSTLREFAEPTGAATRVMYAAPARRTTHRVARLDLPTPSFMRGPGECPGMFALESAMDELAVATGIDPVELRFRNEPVADPESGLPFSSRNLVACLREGARRFGWADRDPRPGIRRRGHWLTGTGVACSTYPARRMPSKASAEVDGDDFLIRIAAADIGTGSRTALARIAADALEVPLERIRIEVGDSSLPSAFPAVGSMGTSSWGSAVVKACEGLLKDGEKGTADTTEDVAADSRLSRHAFGAQFAEVHVDPGTGEVRVPRLFGVFAAGRIIDPTLARSQFIGGMTMGIGMALMEQTVIDERFGDFLNTDLAQYHIAANADVQDVDATWVEEDDPYVNPIGAKGVGEVGIVGTAAAIANAVHHATGIRVRDLPITPATILGY